MRALRRSFAPERLFPAPQARKLEGEVDSKLAAFSKLGAAALRQRAARPRLNKNGAPTQGVTSLRRCSATAATRCGAPTRRGPRPAPAGPLSAARAAQLVSSRGEEIEALLQRLSDVNDAMSRCAAAARRVRASG